MFYLKLLAIVALGSIGIWLAVQKLVVSTDHMADSFTAENYGDPAARAAESLSADPLDVAELALEGNPGSPVDDSDAQKTINNEPGNQNALEQAFPDDLDQVIEQNLKQDNQEAPALQVIVNDAQQTEADELKIIEQSQTSKSEKVRADSDADMQSDDQNAADNVKSDNNSQGIELDLDKKLLDTLKPAEIMKDSVKSQDKTIKALDLAFGAPQNSDCAITDDNYPRVGVHYRPGSYAIKGKSLTSIDKLIALYKKCGGKLLVLKNKIDPEESDEHLVQLRQDEVKYYLLQRRVPKSDILFPDD